MTDAMPHLDDAGENDDVVALLRQQHHHIRDLFAEVENATADDRAEAFRRLVRLLAVHETAEEEAVTPQPAVSCRTVSTWSTIVSRRRGPRRRS